MAGVAMSGVSVPELVASRERTWRELDRITSKRPGHRTREGARERVRESMVALDEEIVQVRSRLRHLVANEQGPLSVSRLGALAALLYAREHLEPLLLEDIERDSVAGEPDPWPPDDATIGGKAEQLRAHIAAIDEEIARRPIHDEGTDRP